VKNTKLSAWSLHKQGLNVSRLTIREKKKSGKKLAHETFFVCCPQRGIMERGRGASEARTKLAQYEILLLWGLFWCTAHPYIKFSRSAGLVSTQAAIFAPASSFLPSALLFLLDVERLCIEKKKRGVLWRRRIHQGDKCALNLLFRFLLLSTRQHSSTPYTYKFLLGREEDEWRPRLISSSSVALPKAFSSGPVSISPWRLAETFSSRLCSSSGVSRKIGIPLHPLFFSISHSGRALNGQRGKSTGISSVTQHWDSVPSLSLSLSPQQTGGGEMVDLRARGLDGNEGTRHRRRSAYTDVSILHLQRLN